ncbi:MAG: hypothetical protein AAB470_00910 [Patescibacteria group bacterium]
MNTKTLSNRALSTINQYLNFRVGTAVCSIPYFNNKTIKARATLRAYGGKGSPKDIFEEIQTIAVKSHVNIESLTNESLKKILTDNNIGIDCSGFVYYILNAQSEELKNETLDRRLSFVNCHGLIGKIRCSLRPIENCDVGTLAHDKNSLTVPIKEISPSDIITMIGDSEENEHDHILVIHQVEYQNFIPCKIHYSHAVAYPEDGIYGTGIRQGTIEIVDPDKSISEARWIENNKEGVANRIFIRATKSKTEMRRLR